MHKEATINPLNAMIFEQLALLLNLAPEYYDQIYGEVKSEANLYSIDGEYERLCRCNRLLLSGYDPEVVLTALKNHEDRILDLYSSTILHGGLL